VTVDGAFQYEKRVLVPTRAFDLEDAFAAKRRTRGPHPRPIEPIVFRLLAEVVGGVRRPLTPPLELVVRRNASGHHLFFDTVRVADGGTRRVTLAGRYVVRIESPFYQTFEAADLDLPLPGEPFGPVELQPGYAYPFPPPSTDLVPQGDVMVRVASPTLLRGGILTTDGQGIAGVTVRAGDASAYRTDASGQWVLVFPSTQAEGNVDVAFTMPGAPGPITVHAVGVVPGRETSLGQSALRGWVQTRDGRALAGATVGVRGALGEDHGRSTSAADGRWAFHFPPNVPAADEVMTVTITSAGAPPAVQQAQVLRRRTVLVPTVRI